MSKTAPSKLDIVHVNSAEQQRRVSHFLNGLRNLILDGSKSVQTIQRFLEEEPNKQALLHTRLDTKIHKGQTVLHLAVLHPHNKKCTLLHQFIQHRLALGQTPDVYNHLHQTPLHLAAELGRLEAVELLVTHGAFLAAKDAKGDTPLHTAAASGFSRVVEFLLTNGANPSTKNRARLIPAVIAHSVAAGREVEPTADKEEEDEVRPAVSYYECDLETAFSFRSSTDSQQKYSGPAIVVKANAAPAVTVAAATVAPTSLGSSTASATSNPLAWSKSELRASQLLIRQQSRAHSVALLSEFKEFRWRAVLPTALTKGSLEDLDAFLNEYTETKMFINSVTSSGFSPLYLALKRRSFEMVSRVLEKGANPDIQNINSTSCLHAAVESGDLRLTEEILRHSRNNAAFFFRNNKLQIPLEVALSTENGGFINWEVVNVLVERMLEAVPRSYAAATIPPFTDTLTWALRLACKYGAADTVRLLVTAEYLNVDRPTKSGWTPLHVSIVNNQIEVAEVLLSANKRRTPTQTKALVTSPTKAAHTPLFLVLITKMEEAHRIAWLRLLCSYGADINALRNGVHPLHLLLRKKNIEACRVAVADLGARVDVAHPQHRTPLWHAFKAKLPDLALLFAQKGGNKMAFEEYYHISALFEATRRGWSEVVAEFLRGFRSADPTNPEASTSDSSILENYYPESEISFASMAILKQLDPAVLEEISRLLSARNALNLAGPTNGTTALHTAVMMGSHRAAELLCQLGADPNVPNAKQVRPLTMAIKQRDSQMASLLSQQGASFKLAFAKKGLVPLLANFDSKFEVLGEYLAQNQEEVPRASMFAVNEDNQSLLTFVMGLPDNRVNTMYNATSQSLLHLIVKQNKTKLAQILFDTAANLDIDIPDSNQWTPLHVAIQCGYKDIALALIDHGADPTLKNNKGLSAFLLAMAVPNEEMKEVALELLAELAKKVDLNEENAFCKTALDYALRRQDWDLASKLVELGAKKFSPRFGGGSSWSLLTFIASLGHTSIAQLLLSSHSQMLNHQDVNGWTPLHVAVAAKHTGVVELLVDSGADIGLATDKEWTVFHTVARKFSLETDEEKQIFEILLEPVKRLMKSGYSADKEQGLALLNGNNLDGITALDIALKYDKEEIARTLLALGATSSSFDFTLNRQSLHHAVMQRDQLAVVLLLEEAKKQNKKRYASRRHKRTQVTPLHLAARNGDATTVALLLSAGANPKVTDKAGRTCLHHAVVRRKPKVVRLLMKLCPSIIDIKDRQDKAALEYATGRGRLGRLFTNGVEKRYKAEPRRVQGRIPHRIKLRSKHVKASRVHRKYLKDELADALEELDNWDDVFAD